MCAAPQISNSSIRYKPPPYLGQRNALLGWVIYLIIVFLFIEASLQIFYRLTTGASLYFRDKPAIWSSDPVSGLTNKPLLSYRHLTPEFTAEIYTNSDGFRVSIAQEEYERQKRTNTFRILLLGPSFAFGWGVNFDQTFGAQLQRLLIEASFADGATIEVLNHGVPALPAANGLKWFNHSGRHYSPNLVIQFVYGSLEVSVKPDTSLIVKNGYAVPVSLSGRDKVWNYAKMSATVFYSGILLSRVHELVAGNIDGSIEGAGRALRNSPVFRSDDPYVKESLLFYKALKEAVEEAGADLLIVHFPLAYVVHQEDRVRWALQGLGSIDRQVAFNHAFSAYLNDRGIRCFNLTNDLIESAKKEKSRLYFWLDVHWTEQGNKVSAQMVKQYLMKTQARLTDSAGSKKVRN